jgi:putative addiction module killer protein
MDYTLPVREIFKSSTFEAWFSGLKDQQARARIAARIDRLSLGIPGDVKPVGAGVSEMRINYGPGYRIYFTQPGADHHRDFVRRGQTHAGRGYQAGDRDCRRLE